MSQFAEHWQMDSLFVVDAAFYNEPNLNQVQSLRWLSRVPQTLKSARRLIQSDTSILSAVACSLPDYRMWELPAEYGGIPQRWLLIESQSRAEDTALWEPELLKLEKRLTRELKQLQQRVFACEPDALDALMRFHDSLLVHQVSRATVEVIRPKRPRGRPAKNKAKAKAKTKSSDTVVGYRVTATLERRPGAEETYRRQRSRFILATNQLEQDHWPAQRLLQEYKGQQTVERGFRFLKDPLFFTSSLFVKKPQRVEALALVMAITLMIYTLAERTLRNTLAEQHQTVLDQKRKPTARPTF